MNTRDGFLSAIEMMQQSARLVGSFIPGRGLLWDWPELDNKIEAFRLFQSADRVLHLPVDRLPLDEVVERALTEHSQRAIWILEGVGYIKATSSRGDVKGLLTEGQGARLPGRAMISLHAGMGTAFAEKWLGSLPSRPTLTQIQEAIQGFLAACRSNCRPGWEDACMESLGLIVRLLYPDLLPTVSAEMGKIGPAMRALFWHGVGRSLYFQPTNFLPLAGSQRRMFYNAGQESALPDDRRNVVAGLVWAVSLVNLSQPVVIRSAAAACAELKMKDEFVNGFVSALMAWRNMAPEDVRYSGTYQRPLSATDRQAALWKDWILTPAQETLLEIYPGLERRNLIPSLYSFRTWDDLKRSASGQSGEAEAPAPPDGRDSPASGEQENPAHRRPRKKAAKTHQDNG
jgi:hypothetical protein